VDTSGELKLGALFGDDAVLGGQVAGPSGQMTWIRGGPTSLDSRNIAEAIDGRWSIGRLFCSVFALQNFTLFLCSDVASLVVSSGTDYLVRKLVASALGQAHSKFAIQTAQIVTPNDDFK